MSLEHKLYLFEVETESNCLIAFHLRNQEGPGGGSGRESRQFTFTLATLTVLFLPLVGKINTAEMH